MTTDTDKLYDDLMDINDRLSKLPVFPSLAWVWCFDILRDIFDNNQIVDLAETDIADEGVPVGVTLKQIFDKFYQDIDTLGISMDDGGEILEEVIRDWMRDNDFLVSLEDDDWLEEDADDD
jgi:hypothetical protein